MQTSTTQNYISPQQQQQQSPHQHNLPQPQQDMLCDSRDLSEQPYSSTMNIQLPEAQTIQHQPQPPMHQQLPHQHMEEKKEGAKMCFVCCSSITDTNYESVKSSMNHSHAPLLVLLTDVLGYKLNQAKLHSEVVCKSCYHLLDIIDELQQTLAESKTDVRTKFLETLSKMKLKYPRTDKMLKPRCLRCIQMSSSQIRKRGRGGRGCRGRGADVDWAPKGRYRGGAGRGKEVIANMDETQQINTENDTVDSQSGDFCITRKVLNPDDPEKQASNILQGKNQVSTELAKEKYSARYLDKLPLNDDSSHEKIRSANTNYFNEDCSCVEDDLCFTSNSKLFCSSRQAINCSDSCYKYEYDITKSCFSCGSNDEKLMCLVCSNCNICKAVIVKWGYDVKLDFKGILGEINKVVVLEDFNKGIFTFISDRKEECYALGQKRKIDSELEKDTSRLLASRKCLKKSTGVTESVHQSRQTNLNKEDLENELDYKCSSHISKQIDSKYEKSPIVRHNTEIMKNATANENVSNEKNKANLLSRSNNKFPIESIILDDKNNGDGITNKNKNKMGKMCKKVKEKSLSIEGKLKYICEICGKNFNSRGGFTYHVLGHQKPYKDIFSCEFCPHTSRKISDLRKHVSIHTGEKSFLCNICKRSFSFNSSYRRHMRIHNEEKNHSCNVCKKVFRTIDNLKAHKVKHSGERKYKCELCGKSFLLKHHYTTHLKLHTGKIKNKCQICYVNFRFKSELNEHCKKHHLNEEMEGTALTIVNYKKPDVLQQAMAAVDNDSMEIYTLAENSIESSIIESEGKHIMEDQHQENASKITSKTPIPKSYFSSKQIPSIIPEDLKITEKKTESGSTAGTQERELPLTRERGREKGASGESSQMYFVLSDAKTDNQQLYYF